MVSVKICGDKCLDDFGLCHCGDDDFYDTDEDYYCCTPKNITCEETGFNEYDCPVGQKLSLDAFCVEQDQCPISLESGMAITSNCTANNQYCPIDYNLEASKICLNSVPERKIEDYCNQGSSSACAKANEGLTFEQCYSG